MSQQTRRDFVRRTTCAALSGPRPGGFRKLGRMNLHARSSCRRLTRLVWVPRRRQRRENYVPSKRPTTTSPCAGDRAGSARTPRTCGIKASGFGGSGLWSPPSLPSSAALPHEQARRAATGHPGEPVTQARSPRTQDPSLLALLALDQIRAGDRAADQRIPTLGRAHGDATLTCTRTLPDGDVDRRAALGASLRTPAIQKERRPGLVLNGSTLPGDARARTRGLRPDHRRSAMLIAAASDVTQQAVDISSAFSVDPSLTTVFPDTYLGAQLHQVAKVIKFNQTSPQLSLNRQIFFVTQGGYDTHQDQGVDHAGLLAELSAALNAFYAATLELNLADRVTSSPSRTAAHPRAIRRLRRGGHGPWMGKPPVRPRRRGLGRQLLWHAERVDRLHVPRARHGRPGRHVRRRSRPMDPDLVRRAVRSDAGNLVRRADPRAAVCLPAHRNFRPDPGVHGLAGHPADSL